MRQRGAAVGGKFSREPAFARAANPGDRPVLIQISRAALDKFFETLQSARFQFVRGPDRFAISAIARSWKSIHRSQKMPEPRNRKKLCHRHPIDLPPHD